MSAPDLSSVYAVLVGALKAAAPLTAQLGDGAAGILDDVPEDYNHYPFVEIGELTAAQEDATGSDGYNAMLIIRIWTKAGGQKTTNKIYGAIRAVLHAQQFAAAGFRTCQTQIKAFLSFKPGDGVIYPGTIHLEIIAAE
jgi:Protein of unknown function (DUF3168)